MDEVFQNIQNYIASSKYDKHNIPQYIFITDENKKLIPDIHILHTETLNQDMHLLGYTDFDIIINNNNLTINYFNYLNKNSIELINEFYHFDFILFNYDKII